MMKKFLSALLAATVLLSMVACGAPAATVATEPAATELAATATPTDTVPKETVSTEPTPTEPEVQDVLMPPEMVRYYLEVPVSGSIEIGAAIEPLQLSRSLPTATAQNGIEPYSEWRGSATVSADLSQNPALAYSLTFSNKTSFSAMPEGFDSGDLLQWGLNPGLNVDILHKHGFTGKGAVIAYVDQAISDHPAYANVNLHYTNLSNTSDSIHGPNVLSMLAGADTGTAPEAEVYYYATPALEEASPLADALYAIIEQNKHLPDDKKITMVGFSNNMNLNRPNEQAFTDAVAACEEAGIMVWFCGEYSVASFLPYSDRNNPANLVRDGEYGSGNPPLVHVPGSGRTSASENLTYVYWATGGLSWTMPYMLGLYAIATEIDPTLTEDDIRALVKETATQTNNMNLVNPVGFITAVLRKVGRDTEATAIEDDVAARSRYLYAVINSSSMTKADLQAVRDYLALMTDVTVLVVDAAHFGNAQQLYTALQADATARGGETGGVQIFGNADMVPSFILEDRVQMLAGVHDLGPFLSDLFYGNWNNDAAIISNGYNVMEHFEKGWDVDLIPQWPVVRLPLSKGDFSAFFKKYNSFAEITGLQRQELVNFSNPIFATSQHNDDMGIFLNRMKEEFGLLDIPYRLYGNNVGQYPVTTATRGGFTAEELSAENAAGITEFLINSHGQWNNIDKCYYENDQELRASLINMDTINSVLGSNPYYLDVWTCNNGYNMKNNLTTTALSGNCVGMFSATAAISGNGADCSVSLSQMAKSNFYYFYYHYLSALHTGATRSKAFFIAQKEYAAALISHSASGISRREGNYQFNLHNLLTYHNFGVIEPVNSGASAQSFQTEQPELQHAWDEVQYHLVVHNFPGLFLEGDRLNDATVEIHSFHALKPAADQTRFVLDCTTSRNMGLCLFPAGGNQIGFSFFAITNGGKRAIYLFDVPDQEMKNLPDGLCFSFEGAGVGQAFVSFLPETVPISAALPEQPDIPTYTATPTKSAAQREIESAAVSAPLWNDSSQLQTDMVEIHNVTREFIKGKIRFTIDFTAQSGMELCIMDSGSGVIAKCFPTLTTGTRETRTLEISSGRLRSFDGLAACFTVEGFESFVVKIYPDS